MKRPMSTRPATAMTGGTAPGAMSVTCSTVLTKAVPRRIGPRRPAARGRCRAQARRPARGQGRGDWPPAGPAPAGRTGRRRSQGPRRSAGTSRASAAGSSGRWRSAPRRPCDRWPPPSRSRARRCGSQQGIGAAPARDQGQPEHGSEGDRDHAERKDDETRGIACHRREGFGRDRGADRSAGDQHGGFGERNRQRTRLSRVRPRSRPQRPTPRARPPECRAHGRARRPERRRPSAGFERIGGIARSMGDQGPGGQKPVIAPALRGLQRAGASCDLVSQQCHPRPERRGSGVIPGRSERPVSSPAAIRG